MVRDPHGLVARVEGYSAGQIVARIAAAVWVEEHGMAQKQAEGVDGQVEAAAKL